MTSQGTAHGRFERAVNSGEVCKLIAKQDPEGVRDYSRIAWCRPQIQMIQSG